MNLENLRVLHVSTWKVPCGIATYCENLVRALEQCGVQNSIAPVHPAEWKYWLADDIQRWQTSVLDAARDADVVHIQHEHGLFGCAVSGNFAIKRFGSLLTGIRDLGKPVVTTFHTDLSTRKQRGLRGRLDVLKRRFRWSRHVCHHFGGGDKAKAIVHSAATRRSFVKHGFPIESVQIVPHACLAPRAYTVSPQEAKESLGLPPNSILLSIFGFIGRYKGHDLAIEALEQLPENYHLAIVGGMHPESSDDFLDQLLTSIPESLAKRVHITGWVDKETADHYFAATDVCLAPYRGDTLLSGSGAITWGISSGRPVIASKIEAFQNVDRLGNCLFLVAPEKTAELAWAVRKVIRDGSLRDRLVANARRFADTYSWERSIRSVSEIYASVLPDRALRTGEDLTVYPGREAA